MIAFFQALVTSTSAALLVSTAALAQVATPAADLSQAISALGDFDYIVRMEAARLVRRTGSDTAVPALVAAANQNEDSYVQFRAAVLLYGFGGAQADAFFRAALASQNDRVRAAAYDYAEHSQDPDRVSLLLAALDHETSEFVRPALIRALAAHDDNAAVRVRLVREIDRGEGFFRGAVIEALGDYRATYAVESITQVASQEGPLRDDALLALGKIGDERALSVLSAALTEVGDASRPVVAAAVCLLGVDCSNQFRYVINALAHGAAIRVNDSPIKGADQALLRGAATGVSALAMAGSKVGVESTAALKALFDVGISAPETARAPIAIALGRVALRTPERVRSALAMRVDLEASLLLLRDAFDMLDEDISEERFYVLMRDRYWDPATSNRERVLTEVAMQVLEY